MNSRGDLICRSLLLLIFLVLWAPRLTGPINFRWDASAYYVLGTALAEGKGYRLLNEPGDIQAVQYPPLLPTTVAAVQRIMGTSDYFKVGWSLRLLYCLISGVFLFMTYALARLLLSPWYALLVGTIVALCFSSFLGASDALYAEMPFAAVTVAFFLSNRKNRPSCAIATALLAIAAYLLRSAGLALLLAWIGESVIKKQFRQAAVRLAIAAMPVLLWQSYVWRVTQSYEYSHPQYSYQRADYNYPNVTYAANSRLIDPFDPELGHMHFRDTLGRLIGNITAVPVTLGESAILSRWAAPFFFEKLNKSLPIPIPNSLRVLVPAGLGFVGLLALTGSLLVARSRHWLLSLYFGITIGMIVVTPWQNQFYRYLAPLAPLSVIFMFATLRALKDWAECRYSWWRETGTAAIMIGFPTAIVLAQVAVAVHLFRSRGDVSYYDASGHERVFELIDYAKEFHALDSAFEWIRRNTDTPAVVASTVPHLAYLRTGHKAVLPPFETNPEAASGLLDEVPVKYLVLDQFRHPGISERYAAPVIAARPQNWRLVFTAPGNGGSVYERTP